MTIKEILNSLDALDKAKLMYAFEHGLSQFVEFEQGQFIGVNTDYIKRLKSETTVGVWSIGCIAKGQSNVNRIRAPQING